MTTITAGRERGFAYFRIVWRRWQYWFWFNLCMFVVIVGVCAVLYVKFGISPKNWLGYWGLMTAISGMAKGRLAEAVATTVKERIWPGLGSKLLMEERT